MTQKPYELYIDTSKINETYVSLTSENKRYEKTIRRISHASQEVLPTIEDLLREHGLLLSDISAVSVCSGPGSYTGLKVGIAVAISLSKLLNITINGKPPGSLIDPDYGKDAWG